MISNLFKGFGHIFSGLKLITQPGIRRFVMIPLSINIALFGGATWYLFIKFDEWINQLLPDFPDWLSWLETMVYWILWPLFSIMILLVIFYTFSFIANLIAAPFNSLLAEKVENYLTNKPVDTGPSYPTMETIKRSIGSELGKLLYFFYMVGPVIYLHSNSRCQFNCAFFMDTLRRLDVLIRIPGLSHGK